MWLVPLRIRADAVVLSVGAIALVPSGLCWRMRSNTPCVPRNSMVLLTVPAGNPRRIESPKLGSWQRVGTKSTNRINLCQLCA